MYAYVYKKTITDHIREMNKKMKMKKAANGHSKHTQAQTHTGTNIHTVAISCIFSCVWHQYLPGHIDMNTTANTI